MPILASLSSSILASFKLIGREVSTGSTVSRIFTTTGIWTVPSGVTRVDYVVVAGGGGGGRGGGGGGAGGYLTGASFGVTPLETYTIIVGSGGAGGTSDATAASNGTKKRMYF